MASSMAKYTNLKRKYNQKEEENLCLREKIRELESNRCNSNGINQTMVTRLELECEAAKGDCKRLREENNALRDDMQRLKESQRASDIQLHQAKEDFDRCVSQFEVERQGLNMQIKQLKEDLRLCQERVRDMQAEVSDQRARCNHLKVASEQSQRELQTTQDLLHQSEAQLASALDRVHQLCEEGQNLEWQLQELKQERVCLQNNMARLDQEKDALLLKVDEKTEQNVRLEAEIESRDHRIANLEGFVADLQKKLDVALDTAARSEHNSRQHVLEADRLRKEVDKMERCRDNLAKENSRLQDDLAAMTCDHQQISRSLEASRREAEDLKLQLQQYVAEVRRITDILEQKEAERMAMLEQYRSLTAESAHLESNNQSLESEAKSTRSRLRDANNQIQDLETTLAEKKALVQGYEKEIKDLTHQVAKLERKLETRSRAESATKEVSRDLEEQNHCLLQKVDKFTCENKQLEEEVGDLRGEMRRLQDQLGKERKNSATLENVLASTRQETIQRARDNGELKAQVTCLQGKLRELHDKLEHGSEALRRCQTECADYQTQVAQLKREVTHERFERARLQENRSGCYTAGNKGKRLVDRSRSRSLPDILQSMKMGSAEICPCCFLNRISLLRSSTQASSEHKLDYNQAREKSRNLHTPHNPSLIYDLKLNNNKLLLANNEEVKVCSVSSTLVTNSSEDKIESCVISEDSQSFMLPEKLHNLKFKNGPGVWVNPDLDCKNISQTTVCSMGGTEHIADQINFMLEEQKRFFKELDLPIREEGVFTLEMDQTGDHQVDLAYSLTDDDLLQLRRRKSVKKNQHNKHISENVSRYAASGDQENIKKIKMKNTNKPFIKETTANINKVNEELNKRMTKPIVHFNDEPVKLPKKTKWIIDNESENDLNKDKNLSVKMIFFPENHLGSSSSAIVSHLDSTSVNASSVYVTAANTSADVTGRPEPKLASYTVARSRSETTMKQFNSS